MCLSLYSFTCNHLHIACPTWVLQCLCLQPCLSAMKWLCVASRPACVSICSAHSSKGFMCLVMQMPLEDLVQSLKQQSSSRPHVSQYLGVSQNGKHWKARIRCANDKKRKHLGTFTSEIEAAYAFDRAAVRAKGINAKTNFHLSEYKDLMSAPLTPPACSWCMAWKFIGRALLQGHPLLRIGQLQHFGPSERRYHDDLDAIFHASQALFPCLGCGIDQGWPAHAGKEDRGKLTKIPRRQEPKETPKHDWMHHFRSEKEHASVAEGNAPAPDAASKPSQGTVAPATLRQLQSDTVYNLSKGMYTYVFVACMRKGHCSSLAASRVTHCCLLDLPSTTLPITCV